MRGTAGLTLLETIVAIAICGIVLATLATASTSSLRQSRDGNFRIQATQVLDTLGRRVAGGNESYLLPEPGSPVVLGYEDLGTLVDLRSDAREALFRASVTNLGEHVVGTTKTVRYGVEVCFNGAEAERCVMGRTLGRLGGEG